MVSEITKYETSREERNEELSEYKTKIELIRNSIPDFNEKTYKLYVKYYETLEEYERTLNFYEQIEARIEKRKAELENVTSSITEYTECIAILEKNIENVKSESNI